MEMKELITQLIEDYNTYSELIALNREHIKEGRGEREILEWNRGQYNYISNLLSKLAADARIKLQYEYGPHPFGFDDWKRTLEYRTVRLISE